MLLLYIYPLENLLNEKIIPVRARDLYITLNREYLNAWFQTQRFNLNDD